MSEIVTGTARRGSATDATTAYRIDTLFESNYRKIVVRTDRLFAYLMIGQWLAAIVVAIWLSPFTWAGRVRVVHGHVFAAIVLGGAIVSLPIALGLFRPGRTGTRYVIACSQMLFSGLLIHLTGGRIETHFHIFGSLAFLAFYRDLKLLIPASIVTAVDHIVRGIYWPESIFGVTNPEWWRALEHIFWVVFCDVFLIVNCIESYRDLRRLSRRQVEADESRDRLQRIERLAAVGQLAASVGHELRNPLAAVRNAHSFIVKRLRETSREGDDAIDPKIGQFLELMDRELAASGKIIANLLDFSRIRRPVRSAVPLRQLVQDAIEALGETESAAIRNEVPENLPVPQIDRDQMRQVLLNLLENALQAVPSGREAQVTVRASGGGAEPWQIEIEDNGSGIRTEQLDLIFEPLFSTKTKGTGLGLAVVMGIVEHHHGSITVESDEGLGTVFRITLPSSKTEARDAAE